MSSAAEDGNLFVDMFRGENVHTRNGERVLETVKQMQQQGRERLLVRNAGTRLTIPSDFLQ